VDIYGQLKNLHTVAWRLHQIQEALRICGKDALCSSLMWDGHNFENNHIRVDPPIVVQVKEKFGTLRFYVDNATKEDRIKIDFAEFLSGTICESCGATRDVSRTKRGWVKTRCLTCQQEAGDIEYGN